RPLLVFTRMRLAESGGRAAKNRAAKVRKPRLHLGIGEAGVDLSVELVDNCGGRVLRRADAEANARLVAGDNVAYRWNVRELIGARRGRHRQRTQFAAPDVFN